ncbi:molecular chaperone [Ramlibacter rhizophilus]|uniref:Molecular chaperone n=1 Tax=Ramlibacter rhizophilus TaxID=1781167 RepID=A0A4Z0BDH4_9BURK|nr:fimbria/pilus periplasmic chaperone [Ramlibacter rhizophilus]TFY97356.1 molecular chaperone [Ramlibacter rhizophilus]
MRCIALPTKRLARLLACLLALGLAAPAGAGFSVSPMRLELGPEARSGTLTLRNEGTAPQSFSIRAMAWRQDESGDDVYEDTPDLVYFPRLLTLEPGQDAAVRLGPRQPPAVPGGPERSWRLFVEELPPTAPASAPPAPGALVRVLVRFGVPVFAAWNTAARQLALDALKLEAGAVHWLLRNQGNRHEVFESIVVSGRDRQGQPLFAEAVPARYLLAGAQRRFKLAVPPGACAQLARIELQIKTAHGAVHGQLQTDPAACP